MDLDLAQFIGSGLDPLMKIIRHTLDKVWAK